MNKNKFLVVLGLISLPLSGMQASEVNVEWTEPSDFIDIRSDSAGQKRFQAKVLEEISEQFQESGLRYLPENQTLNLQITDVDLAGRIDYFIFRNQPIRIVRNIDYPRINFSYEIIDENDQVVASGEEKIKDMGFNRSGLSIRFNNDALHYEKDLIDDWFKDNF